MEGTDKKISFALAHEEEAILSTFVDAILGARSDLENAATLEDWDRILLDACRKQRIGSNSRSGKSGQPALVAA